MVKGAFQSFGFSPKLLESIKIIGYSLPTPIQRKCFPSILAGRDVVAMARTGSGKTAGFVLPMIERLGCSHSQIVGIRGVILSPTRELALQTYRVVRKLACKTNMVVCALTGGSSLDRQFESLSGNPDIVVATPGRLFHHIIEAGLSLIAVKIIILDEADRLFEMGLADQIEKILESIPKTRQCILVSATMPTSLASFSKVRLNEPEVIQIDSDYILSETLKLTFLFVREDEKLASLLFLLRNTIPPHERAIVFCATKHHVDYIVKILESNNITVSYIYGNMDQEARTMHLSTFRKNKSRALIVTDIAARGVDIPMIKYVINFDFPLSPKLFVHRTGRTARAGQEGRAFSLITSRDLPYTMDLCLFLGFKMTTLTSKQTTDLSNDGLNTEKKLEVGTNDDEIHDEVVSSVQPVSFDDSNNNSRLILASFPDLTLEIESIGRIITGNSEIERCRRSMESSYLLYLKTRASSSKESLKRSRELLDKSGGVSKILMSIHPDLNINRDETNLNNGSLPNLEVISNPLIEHLKSFRPTENKAHENKHGVVSQATGKMILKSSVKMKKIKDMSIIANSILNKDKLAIDTFIFERQNSISDGISQNNSIPQIIANKKRKPKKQCNRVKESKHFFIPYKNSEEEISRSAGLQLESSSFDINPDEEGEMKRQKCVRKWNSKRKRYELLNISKQNSIKKVNESGVKVKGELKCTGQYKKWKANTNLKIQNVGEIEDRELNKSRGNNKFRDKCKMIDSNFSFDHSNLHDKHKGIIEAINKGIKLTHKQKRIAKRIGIINERIADQSKNPKNEIRTPQQILKKRVNEVKQRMKNDPEYRRKQLAKKNKELAEKNLKKVIQKGRPNRSKVVIVEKRR
ncbi:DEAD DEAH box helicase family [Cryptosporidium sp. chipmunk genotype I]|uniref:DEAD DEAH box helicase family n=1 Tax=Cryptosporidium sp. chipmunk genotype I TaxID=1280935 RepID=UPI00351A532F|nr:DEAD DEAH box helicase family [Cryptosporidium sp. chipmunk genotype I]